MTRSFIHSFIRYSFVHPCVRSFVRSFTAALPCEQNAKGNLAAKMAGAKNQEQQAAGAALASTTTAVTTTPTTAIAIIK